MCVGGWGCVIELLKGLDTLVSPGHILSYCSIVVLLNLLATSMKIVVLLKTKQNHMYLIALSLLSIMLFKF